MSQTKSEVPYVRLDLYGWVTHEQTLRCAWNRVHANGGEPGVDGITFVSLTAKACGQVMSIVRYADDCVILARKWVDGFVEKVVGRLNKLMKGWGTFYSVG